MILNKVNMVTTRKGNYIRVGDEWHHIIPGPAVDPAELLDELVECGYGFARVERSQFPETVPDGSIGFTGTGAPMIVGQTGFDPEFVVTSGALQWR